MDDYDTIGRLSYFQRCDGCCYLSAYNLFMYNKTRNIWPLPRSCMHCVRKLDGCSTIALQDYQYSKSLWTKINEVGPINPFTAIDANWCHENCWWCHFLGNFPLKIGSATTERLGRREVGGVTRRVKMAPAKPCAACEAHPVGAERATCRVFSMSECRKQSFPLAAPPNCMFHGCF